MSRKHEVRVGLGIVAWLLGVATLMSSQVLRADGLPEGVAELVLEKRWEEAFGRLKDVKFGEADGVCRLVAAHACIATNHNNRSLLLILSLDPEHLQQWADWTAALVEATPMNAVACYLHGDAWARTGGLEEAERHFTLAIKLDREFAMPLVGRGFVAAIRRHENPETSL